MPGILVLCVDRDDDLGQKAKIKGPVIGVENNLKAATAMLEIDPAESDGNTMFEAVKVFRELGKDAGEVATITGHPSRGYTADKKLKEQLEEIVSKGKYEGVYLVTDGADDDQLVPIIHSQLKIVSKKTLIIKQAKELEKSYYVIKQILQEPTFARIVFGLPGLVLLTVALLQELGLKIIIFLVGLYLMLKGFGLEEPIIHGFREFRQTTSIERASFPLYIGSFLMLVLSIWSGIEKTAVLSYPNVLLKISYFVLGFATLFVIAMILFLLGRIGDMYYRKEQYKIKNYMSSLVSMITLWIVLTKGAHFVIGTLSIDEFIIWVIFAFFISIIGINTVKRIYINRFIEKKLKKGLEVFDESGEKVGKVAEVNHKTRSISVDMKKGEGKIPFGKIVLVLDNSVSVRMK